MSQRGVNKVILIGNLGQDPEIRYSSNGAAICNVSVATSESWKDKNTGEQQEKTEWHRVVMFKRLAEIAGEYLNKGSKVYIEGRLQTRKWQDQQGNDRYTTEVVADQMQMLDSRNDGSGAGQANTSAGSQSTSASARPKLLDGAMQPAPGISTPPRADGGAYNDDIPF